MPGPFTQGTEHFPNASHATDEDRGRAYAPLDPLVARNEQATAALFPPTVDAHPRAVAQEITRILALPPGQRPFRSVVDFSNAGVDEVNAVAHRAQEQFLTRLGFAQLLHVKLADRQPAAV